MIALNCLLFACLVSLTLATAGGGDKCQRESGDKSLGTAAIVQVSLASPAVLNEDYPDCRITCIKCLSLDVDVALTVTKGGYGCSNVEGLVDIGIAVGVCEIFGVELGPGEGTVCSS